MLHTTIDDLLHTKAIASQHGCVVFDRANGGGIRHCLYRRVGRRLVFVGARNSAAGLRRLVERTCNVKGAMQ